MNLFALMGVVVVVLCIVGYLRFSEHSVSHEQCRRGAGA